MRHGARRDYDVKERQEIGEPQATADRGRVLDRLFQRLEIVGLRGERQEKLRACAAPAQRASFAIDRTPPSRQASVRSREVWHERWLRQRMKPCPNTPAFIAGGLQVSGDLPYLESVLKELGLLKCP